MTSFQGSDHCGWESVTFLSVDGSSYVADPNGVLGDVDFAVPFDGDTELPADAIDTGYHRGSRQLWLSSDRAVAFVVDGDRVQAWPSPPDVFGCD